jgi:mRNA-degrading endonuclease toxin of MazEF toxin-antitoxin module
VVSFLACAVAVAALMVAARAARHGRALADEVESLSSRLRDLGERVGEAPPRTRQPVAADAGAVAPGGDPEPGSHTVH